VWIVRWTFIALIVLAVLGFSLQNTEMVKISFWTWHSGEVPIYLVMYFAFAAGMLVFLFVALVNHFQHQTQLRRSRREIKRLQEELDRIRTISLEEGLEEGLTETPPQGGETGMAKI
jgi:uncharacterized integral membrane protein